jgi:hypothetical protein
MRVQSLRLASPAGFSCHNGKEEVVDGDTAMHAAGMWRAGNGRAPTAPELNVLRIR